jgi:GNAT superfamily N-acetyltransferase
MITLPALIKVHVPESRLIRRADGGDLSAIAALLTQMHEEDEPINPKSLAAVFDDILLEPNRAILVLEDVQNGILGTLDLFILDNMTRAGRPWAGIENLVVDERWRGRGLGRQLLEVAFDLARTAGCYKVQLISHARRDAAHALYQSVGMDAPVNGYRIYLDKES